MAMPSLWRTGWVTILCLLLIVPLTSTQIYEGECDLDLIFLVDAGASTGNSNFRKLLNAISDYISTEFPVAEEAVHVGVISFSTTPDTVRLSGDLDAVLEGINDLPYRGRHTYTHSAFEMALHQFQSSSRAQTTNQVLILFTDDPAGLSNVAHEAAEELRDFGVEIWCVGIGARAPTSELLAFTGNNLDRVVLTRDYGVIPEAIDLPVACTVYYPPDPPSTTSVLEATSTPQTSLETTFLASDKDASMLTVSKTTATTDANNLKTDILTTSFNGPISVTYTLNDQRTDLTIDQLRTTFDIAHTETSNINDRIDTTSTFNDLKTESTVIEKTVTLDVADTETAATTEGIITRSTMDNRGTDQTTIQPTATLDVGHTETADVQDGNTTRNSIDNHITDHTTNRRTATVDVAHTETVSGNEGIDNTNTQHHLRTDQTTIQPTATLDIGHTETADAQDGSTTPNSIENHITDHTTNRRTTTIDNAHTETTTGYEGIDTTNTMHHFRTDRTANYPTTTLDISHTRRTTVIEGIDSTDNMSKEWTDSTLTVHPTATQDVRYTTEDWTRDVGNTDDLESTPTHTPTLPTSVNTMSYSVSSYVTPIDSTTVTTAPPPSSTPRPVPDNNFTDLLCSKAVEMDGLWLTSHPTDCDKFIQCHFGNEGRLTTAVRLCPRGLFWSKASYKCTDPKDAHCSMDPCRDREVDTYNMDGGCGLYWRCLGRVSHGESCKRGYAYTALEGCIPSPRCKAVSISDETCGNEGPCQRMPLPGNRAYQTVLRAIPGEWITTPCMYGGTFDMASCSCMNSRPFASDCQHIEKIQLQNETYTGERSNSLVFDPTSSRPTALRFRYKPSLSNDDYDERGEILMRSSECSMGGLFVMWEEEDFLETRVFSRDGYFLKASLPLHGLNNTDWRTVDLRFTFSGDLSVKLMSEHLTFTNYIEGGLHLPVSLCGWDAGLPGSLAEQVSPFQGDMEEIYVSRCFDHGF